MTNLPLKSLLILSTILYLHAGETVKTTGTKPVDEGIKTIQEDDKTKGSNDVNNSYEYKTLSLSKIDKSYVIKRSNLTHSPFKALHYNGKNKKFTVLNTIKKGHKINFKIDSSILKIDDRIFIINNQKSKHKKAPLGRMIVIDVEVIK